MLTPTIHILTFEDDNGNRCGPDRHIERGQRGDRPDDLTDYAEMLRQDRGAATVRICPWTPDRSLFVIQALDGCSIVRSDRADTETVAVEIGHSWLSRREPHVVITGHGPSTDTFAVRHLKFVGEGVVDRGWRAWVDGGFIGDVEVWPPRDLVGV